MPYIHIRCVVSIVKETQAQREMQQLLRNTTAGRRWGGSATCLLTFIYKTFIIVIRGICIAD